MLASSRLGDDARLAHHLGEQHLAYSIIDLVSTCMQEVFAFEIEIKA